MTTLNNSQQHSFNIAQQLARFLRKSKSIYSKVTPFHNEVDAFLQLLGEVPANATIKATKGISLTAQKRKLKKEIARDAAQVCTLATAYAFTKNDAELLYCVNHSYTDIYTTKDVVFEACLTIIENAITPHLDRKDFKEYGITANDLAAIKNKAKEFGQSINRGKWINWESDQASRNITGAFKKIKVRINQMNRLLILFEEKHPGFIQGFRQSLIITQKNKARNAIEGIITDNNTGQPLENVTLAIQGSNKTASTNSAGFYHLTGIKAGSIILIISADDCTPQTITAKIIRGKTITLNIHLEAHRFISTAVEVA